MDEYFFICEIELFKAVALCDLMHDVDTLHDKRKLLTTSGYIFLSRSHTPETAICNFFFPGHHPYLENKQLLDGISSYQRCNIF